MRILERERKQSSDIQGRVRSRRLAKLREACEAGGLCRLGYKHHP